MPELPRAEERTICLRNKSEQVYSPYPFSMLLYRGQGLILPTADELRKELIKQAAPNGVKANVVPIKKLIEASKDPRFGNTHALILFETPQEALEAIEGGVPIKELNVGSMAHSTGKTMVNNVLSMDKDDVATFEKLRDLGVTFDVRKVPNDSKKDLFDLIKKANVQ